jgi:hypothetical protein
MMEIEAETSTRGAPTGPPGPNIEPISSYSLIRKYGSEVEEFASDTPEVTSNPEAVRMITLVCPEGAFDYPVSHGEREYYPYRLTTDYSYPTREFGGPWVVDVPIEIYHHFLGPGGFRVYEG